MNFMQRLNLDGMKDMNKIQSSMLRRIFLET